MRSEVKGEPPHGPVDTLKLDIVYALRGWRSQRGATAVAVVTLALGIGATTTVFGFVSGALLKPLPYPDPGQREVYVRPFPVADRKWQVSIQGGHFPAWSEARSEIVFFNPQENRLMSAPSPLV